MLGTLPFDGEDGWMREDGETELLKTEVSQKNQFNLKFTIPN